MRLVHLRKANPGTKRQLAEADFQSLGIEQETVIWEDANNHTVELKNAVADALIDKLEDEFEIVDEPPSEDD